MTAKKSGPSLVTGAAKDLQGSDTDSTPIPAQLAGFIDDLAAVEESTMRIDAFLMLGILKLEQLETVTPYLHALITRQVAR